jgi:alpha-beta hydrolase superfamily lysophospholipase
VHRIVTLVTALAAALVLTGAASAFTKTDGFTTMDDGVRIATTLYLPDGVAPAAGWPAVMMLHGLGGSRRDMNLLAEQFYAPQGYAVLTYDARGHGDSGGLVTVDGPREIADGKALFAQLAARPDVDGARIGGWGISYGGGAVWKMAAEGVPFAAIEPYETWTDLYAALLPQNLSKSGVVFGLVQEIDHPAPVVTTFKDDAIQSRNLAALRAFAAERSTLPQLSQVRVPTFVLQGKRDFLFDMEQAIAAYRRLAGPKRLYLGNLGHAPSTFVADDFIYFMGEGRRWFDRYLKGMPNGIDTSPPVEVAPTPFVASGVRRYRGIPGVAGTTTAYFATRKKPWRIGSTGKLSLAPGAWRLASRLETFGSAVVTVTAATPTRWPHLVAVLSAIPPTGPEIIVADGGMATPALSRARRTLKIRLASTSTVIPARSRLRLTLAATSLAQSPANLVYLQGVPLGSSLSIARVSFTVPRLAPPAP